MRTEVYQVKFDATKISMSQQTSYQAIRTREEKSVAIKKFPIATEIAKESKKSYRDTKNSIATELIG